MLPGFYMIYLAAGYAQRASDPHGELGFMVYLVQAGLAMIASALLSVVALWLNWQDLRNNGPATPRRNTEFALIAMPAVLGGLMLLLVLLMMLPALLRR